MKRLIYFLTAIFFFTGCKKDNGGNLAVTMTYELVGNQKNSSVKSAVKSYSSSTEEYYTQFGDYIASITPSVFIAKFLDMRLLHWEVGGANLQQQLALLDNNVAVASPTRLADFSNNGSVSLTPIYYSGGYDANSVDFNIFEFIPYFFYQEIELPAQYDTVSYLENLSYPNSQIDLNEDAVGGVRNGRIVKGHGNFFLRPIFNNQMPANYVFGSTDSSYSFYADGSPSINNPLGQTGYILRSNAFTNITLNGLLNKSANASGTMTFNTNNLIQIYAGQDNVPYTWDDIFVYAPKYWERLNINLDAN